MARFLGDDGSELIGYTDRWSVRPGEEVRLFVSTSADVYDIDIVRLRHGDPNPAGPGLVVTPVDGIAATTERGGLQRIRCGSYGVVEEPGPPATHIAVWVWTLLPARGREQVILERSGLVVVLEPDGRPSARLDGATVSLSSCLRRERWVQLMVALTDERLTLSAGDEAASVPCAAPAPGGPVVLAAAADGARNFNGRLEQLEVDGRTFDLRDARLVNGPALAVTGRHWRDDTTDFRSSPDEYAAVHFHEDDIEDAGFAEARSLTVPDGFRSGIYAFRLRAGDLVDHVPFTVAPPRGTATAKVAFLVPTLTYLAYANERLVAAGVGGMVPTSQVTGLDDADRWLEAHPEAGLSAYDHHRDGSGCHLVSMLRPIPNLRPDFVWWNTNAPERFGADLYLVDFLEQRGEPWDAITDHDLHAEGVDLLARYRVIVTGTHPEYCSGSMLDAIEQYLDGGGRLMYLGGNGFYWVTSIDPERPHVAEIRRGINGTRAWTSRPGELRHQTTGELGGLWRYRGRAPNRLVGVGFTSQSDAHDIAPGYRRTDASRDPAFTWIFDGVSDADVVGDYGLSLGGAAGYEIDRHDPRLGSPDESTVLMTSSGMHPASYLFVVEDVAAMIPTITGQDNPDVRADVVYLRHPGGGEVFSVGSCSWCGSLSHAGYDNDIARITDNVLRRFASD